MKISIIGLGWLGIPLAKSLKENGYAINGSTTSADKVHSLKAEFDKVYQITLNEDEVKGDVINMFKNSEILILNIPPGLRRNPETNYIKKIANLIPYIVTSQIDKVLFVSSTSVFLDEDSIPTIGNSTLPNSKKNSGIQIQKVEDLLLSNKNFKTTILRFAGLVDERRHPATMISKRKQIPNPKAPVNLIHREDCIGIISEIINQKKWNKIYNAAYPLHPEKKEYYTEICKQMNLSQPDFVQNEISKGKLINGGKTAQDLNYEYEHSIL